MLSAQHIKGESFLALLIRNTLIISLAIGSTYSNSLDNCFADTITMLVQ